MAIILEYEEYHSEEIHSEEIRWKAEPDFDLDIKEDVQEECSKFGVVKRIFVQKNSAGHVCLCFESTAAAMAAQRALPRRWFAGKMITATYMCTSIPN